MNEFATLPLVHRVVLGAFMAALLPSAVGLLRYRHLNRPMRLVLYHCLIGFVLNASTTVLAMLTIRNLFLGHLSTLLEFVLLVSAYRLVLATPEQPKRWLFWSMLVFALVAMLNTVFVQRIGQFNSYIKVPEAIFMVGLSLLYFRKLLVGKPIARLERHPWFWVNAMVLVYFASDFMIFAYSNYILLYSKSLGIHIWFVHALFLILFYGGLSVAMLVAKRPANAAAADN